MPWYRAQFDLEGLGFGALALVLAIVLGAVFWPLGFISFVAFSVIILASRDCERTSPEGTGLVLSPCDGVIESVSDPSVSVSEDEISSGYSASVSPAVGVSKLIELIR